MLRVILPLALTATAVVTARSPALEAPNMFPDTDLDSGATNADENTHEKDALASGDSLRFKEDSLASFGESSRTRRIVGGTPRKDPLPWLASIRSGM